MTGGQEAPHKGEFGRRPYRKVRSLILSLEKSICVISPLGVPGAYAWLTSRNRLQEAGRALSNGDKCMR